jgi:hypothetical protein
MKHGHRFTLVAGSAIASASLLCGAAAVGAAAPGLRSAGTAGAAGSGTPGAAGSGTAAPAEVRDNQVGYATGSPKVAFVMLPGKVGHISFLSGRHGVVFRGRSSTDSGSWNAAYGAVYRLDFSGLRRTGTYRITAHAGAATAVSPPFAVAPAATLYHRLVLNGVRYFTSERDGATVRSSVPRSRLAADGAAR